MIVAVKGPDSVGSRWVHGIDCVLLALGGLSFVFIQVARTQLT
ncbi:hypothetical protein HMPREF9622_01978 [Cutibacterium modestum HL037PA3]|uniref:Uncharacterized protein n=1 Tax=Cutibacterium modestum HL044PA1 TaxID=765109 RepID=A0ABP2KB07_9ACTN|nr:hypothetical protein HMPREF9607_00821 [Cutibacterium modestum HL044PA1]EFT15011.1 hypothetical protein HMPREF9622_01978 [Cutibacterium modestum HL037PA3]EGG25567.1 hypothetical protein PA08_2517 [Cutibacterium modestum P08]